jgi:hypothetical protein
MYLVKINLRFDSDLSTQRKTKDFRGSSMKGLASLAEEDIDCPFSCSPTHIPLSNKKLVAPCKGKDQQCESKSRVKDSSHPNSTDLHYSVSAS